jgi:septal ring factor EnvC (AmiA/AmiB activator)
MLHSKIQESDQIRLSLTANAATQQRITQLTSELDQQRALYRIKCDEVDKLRFQYTKELEEWRSRASRLHASDDYVNHLKSEIERLSNVNRTIINENNQYRATVLSGAAVSVEENQRLRERLSTVVVENDRLKSTLV